MEVAKTYINTYSMLPLVTPAVRRTLATISFRRLATAPPKRLILCPLLCPSLMSSPSNALDLCTVVVMRHQAAAVAVLDFDKVLVAAHAVELRRWGQQGEKGRQCIESGLCGSGKLGEGVVVHYLGGD